MRESRTYETAVKRWAAVGPYYAMFPIAFSDAVVRRFTEPGDTVIDPFAGRGTAVFSAASQDRIGIGIELNPVGWVYAQTKLAPAGRACVERRIRELADESESFGPTAESLPEFFRHCFSSKVRRFLCAGRELLDWRRDPADRTVMAIVLVHLHGKRDASLSNQMRQAKSMAPDYAVRWWAERQMTPPNVDPVGFFVSRLAWRYAKGKPALADSKMYLGDSTEVLLKMQRRIRRGCVKRMRLLLTSPPYFGLTNYHCDQWLRLWMLGGRPDALRAPDSGAHQKRFEDYAAYQRLLGIVFGSAADLLLRSGVIYVRTGEREETLEATTSALTASFPRKRLRRYRRPFLRPTQTRLFGDTETKVGEVDLVLS